MSRGDGESNWLPARVDAALAALAGTGDVLLALLPEPGRRMRLLLEAEVLERRFPLPQERPPLFGMLVGIKDVLHVDGMPTRAGSAVPPEALAGAEAGIVRRLRAQGALILGKTVTAEFAFADPGTTRNPHNHAHTPGGSSSGSAALVGAGLLPLAVGTQTVGSVIRPAAYCGAVGFKPSLGRLPLDGVLLVARSVDTLGLFARDAVSMRRAACALLVDSPGESRRESQGELADERPDDGRDADTPSAGNSTAIRLLVPDGAFMAQVEPEAAVRFDTIVRRLRDAGVEVAPVSVFADLADIAGRHGRLVQREFADAHAARFAQWGALYRPGSAYGVLAGRGVSDNDYAEALASTQQLRARMDIALATQRADAWICPAATGPAPSGHWSTGDPAMNIPFSHAGVPAITLPCDRVAAPGGDLPLGLQLAGAFGNDETLLALAVRLEALLRAAT